MSEDGVMLRRWPLDLFRSMLPLPDLRLAPPLACPKGRSFAPASLLPHFLLDAGLSFCCKSS